MIVIYCCTALLTWSDSCYTHCECSSTTTVPVGPIMSNDMDEHQDSAILLLKYLTAD